MKEYLTKNSNGEYQLVNHRFSDDDIEVPEGATSARLRGEVEFYKDDCTWYLNKTYNEWRPCMSEPELIKQCIDWQREPKYKEFLNSKNGYKLVMLPEHAGDGEKIGLIEVPEGAIKATYSGEYLIFWKDDKLSFSRESGDECFCYEEDKHYTFDEYMREWDDATIVWQRHTQPEELPFIDDEVNHPGHYTTHPSGIECITITRHHDFAIGNAIKYLWRAGLKDSDNEIQDLEKAVWYINDKIEQLKNAK